MGPFLRARGDGESDLARLVRHEVLWEAWLAQLAGAGEGAVPGEVGSGLGRFVRGLAAGAHQVRTLPTTEVVAEGVVSSTRSTSEPGPRWLCRSSRSPGNRLGASHARPAPRRDGRPRSRPAWPLGWWPRTRRSWSWATRTRFDYATTQIRYHQPEQRVAAERLREDLGAGEVIEDVRPIDSFDVTIVLGTDL